MRYEITNKQVVSAGMVASIAANSNNQTRLIETAIISGKSLERNEKSYY
jgi:hypothetical protein